MIPICLTKTSPGAAEDQVFERSGGQDVEIEGHRIRMKRTELGCSIPIGSMYGIFTYIYHKNQPNVGKYTIHGSYGLG